MEFVLAFFILIAIAVFQTAGASRDAKENKSGNSAYVLKRNEDAGVIGGTNLDRFFVECVLAGYTDFSIEKSVAKAKLLAEKYNLSLENGVGALFDEGLMAHEIMTNAQKHKNLSQVREEEKKTYEHTIRYAELYGKDKKVAMLKDQINELLKAAKSMDNYSDALSRFGQQKELNWGTWGGIASGLAGTGAGIATAVDVQAKNAQIRAQNEAAARAVMPEYMAVTSSASKNRANATAIEKQIELLSEKLVSDLSASDVMKLLKVENSTVDVSETGAYVVTASIKAKQPLFIYDDLPAIADGTILAHVLDGEKEIGTAKMVLPVDGVSEKTGIIGMGLSGAEQGKSYNVTFSEYKLWLMEK